MKEGGIVNYWINAFNDIDLQSFNFFNPSATPPPPNNVYKYESDESYLQTLSNANKPLRYDIHLYDLQGNLMRQTTANQTGIVQVNVSGLLDGNYFLHIYDGTGAKPYMKQIVVKH